MYLLFFLMPISGFTNSSAGGYGVKFWGIPLPDLPKNEALSKLAGTAHSLSAYVVYVLIVLHVSATVWHVVFRRDGTLERMIPAQTHADPLP
jgi:cytochrome b561